MSEAACLRPQRSAPARTRSRTVRPRVQRSDHWTTHAVTVRGNVFNKHATYTSGPFILIRYHFTADGLLCLERNLRSCTWKGTRGAWSTQSRSKQTPSEGLTTGERKLQWGKLCHWRTSRLTQFFTCLIYSENRGRFDAWHDNSRGKHHLMFVLYTIISVTVFFLVINAWWETIFLRINGPRWRDFDSFWMASTCSSDCLTFSRFQESVHLSWGVNALFSCTCGGRLLFGERIAVIFP